MSLLKNRTSMPRTQIHNVKEEYLFSRATLSDLIEDSKSSKNLLSEIQNEYDRFIFALHQGQAQASYLKEQCTVIASEPRTLQNLRRRVSELENNISKLKEENKRLENHIFSNIVKSNATDDQMMDSNISSCKSYGGDESNEHDFCAIHLLQQSALTSEESTDIFALSRLMRRLMKKKAILKEDVDKNYDTMERKLQLVDLIKKKDTTLFHLNLHQERLKERLTRLKVAVESCHESSGGRKLKTKLTMYRAITDALSDFGKSQRDFGMQYSTFISQEEDDPQKKKEAESLLEYVDDFNDLIAKGNYKTAAWRAAKSPNGNLRTYNIMTTFKKLESSENCSNPWLEFCDALIATGHCYERLSGALSVEVMRCAVTNKKAQLAMHWWNTGHLTPSRPLGDLLCDACICEGGCRCSLKALAHQVYDKIGSYELAASCLISRGLLNTAISYCQEHALEKPSYSILLKRHPNIDLLWLLLNTEDMSRVPPLSMAAAVNILCNINSLFLAVEALERVADTGLHLGGGRHQSLLDCLMAETVSDKIPIENWYEILKLCKTGNKLSLAQDLLACITVRNALHKASYEVLMDYIS